MSLPRSLALTYKADTEDAAAGGIRGLSDCPVACLVLFSPLPPPLLLALLGRVHLAEQGNVSSGR